MSLRKTSNAAGISIVLLSLLLTTFSSAVIKARGQEAIGVTKPGIGVASGQSAATDSVRTQPATRRRRALLVGISNYSRIIRGGAPWGQLETKNDLELLADVLVRRFQLSPEDIKIISDRPVVVNGKVVPPISPTRKLIIDTFRSFLTDRTERGDVVFFYFAGHGSRVIDQNKDELDGFDETLVPLDYVSTKDGSNDILDDKISTLLEELSEKNPSNVTIAIDSCFSGAATRGDYDVIRGGSEIEPAVPKEKIRAEDESTSDFLTRVANPGGQFQQNYVFLSASSPRQPAIQAVIGGKKYGIFTYSLARAMESADRTTTNRDIYEKVLSVINSGKQRPQIEGSQLDGIFLQEGALPPEIYFPVRVNEYGVFLSGGILQGMTVGSKFMLFPRGTKSRGEGRPIAEARITEVRAADSTLEVEGNVSPEMLKRAARAFEISRNYESVLKVALKDVGDFAGLDEMLKNLGLAATVPEDSSDWKVLIRAAVQEDRDEKIVPDSFRGVILQRREGKSVFARFEDGIGMAENIKDALISEARRITLRSLDNTDPDIKVQMRLIPIEVDWQKGASGRPKINKVIGDKKEGLRYSKGGNIEFKLNDWYRIEVRNLSESGVYITILNLDAGGNIRPVFPGSGQDNFVKAVIGPVSKDSGWMPINDPYVLIALPLGLESLHAIATKEKTDFSPLFDPGIIARGKVRGSSFGIELLKAVQERKRKDQRGGSDGAQRLETAIKSPIGTVLIATQEGKSVRSTSLPPPSWSTVTVNYVVVE